MIGSTFAHYLIEAELGRGGMGIVYRARDTKLDRTVALKVLPPHALASEDDRARFQREARAAAKLHHAHIASIFEIGEAAVVPAGREAVAVGASSGADIRPFIAMEFVDGESVAARVARGPLKLEAAVRIASQMVDALGAAHEVGIVHRDVKSGNVMLTARGEVKVLDFGLAKTAASTQLTRQGSMLGTIAYMSPEQARGEEVDARTDLWALGVVLYELIAGRLPFRADYEQAVLYGILNEQPEPLTAVRTGVPMELEAIVSKLLRKEARLRYQTAADLGADLEAVRSPSGTAMVSAAERPAVRLAPGHMLPGSQGKGSWRVPALMAAAGLLVGVVVTAAVLRGVPRADRTPLADALDVQLRLPGLDATIQQDGRFSDPVLAISPDGRLVAYFGDEPEKGLVIRDLTRSAPAVSISPTGVHPVFSPDSRSIAWSATGSVYRASVTGGVPAVVSSDVPDVVGLSWSDDGFMYLAADYGLGIGRVSEAGGAIETLTIPDSTRGEIGHVCPTMLPDHRTLLMGVYGSSGWEMALQDIENGESSFLGPGICPQFVEPDLVLYAQGYRLLAAVLDPDARRLGDPVTVSETLFANLQAFTLQFDVSRRGDVFMIDAPDGPGSGLVLRRFDGSTEYVRPDVFDVEHFKVSPDGRFLAVAAPYPVADPDLWLYDFETKDTRRLTDNPTYDAFVTWAPDGSIFFASERRGQSDIFRLVPGAGDAQLVSGLVLQQYPTSVSRDGRWVVYQSPTPGLGNDLYAVSTDGTEGPVTLVSQPGEQGRGIFSPVANLLAYESDETGRNEIYVTDFPSTRPRERITVGGGEYANWSADGRSIYFSREGSVYRVPVTSEGRPAGDPALAMEGLSGEFEMLPDGTGLIGRNRGQGRSVRLITRATDRARALMPGK